MSTLSMNANTELSALRVRLALLALALGGLGIGLNEFAAMGLLPNMAADLLPDLYRTSSEAANAQTGVLISAYAAGVVVGAPTITALASRLPRKRLLLILVACFVVSTYAATLVHSFEFVLFARFIAGLPHGAFFGIATLVASSLLGPGNRGKGMAFVLSGLTVATSAGVPIITWIGQIGGWRLAAIMIAGVFALTFVAILVAVPSQPADSSATFRRELRAFANGQVWFAVMIGAIGFGGLFAAYSYVAPMARDVAHLPEGAIPFVLAVFGVGMFIGNLIGGRIGDWSVRRGMYISFTALLVSLFIMTVVVFNPVGLFIGVFLVGLSSSALAPCIQLRLMDVAHESQSIAAALNHSALNIGNSLGAALGALVIGMGYGYVSPIWVGIMLTLAGILLTTATFRLDRLRRDGGAELHYMTGATRTIEG